MASPGVLGVEPRVVIEDADMGFKLVPPDLSAVRYLPRVLDSECFFISYLHISLHCALAQVWLQPVPGRLYLTCFVLRWALALPCHCLALCYRGLAPVLTCPKPNCYDMSDSTLVLTMHWAVIDLP